MFRSSLLLQYLFLVMAIFLFTGCAAIMPKAKSDYTVEIADMDFVFVKGGTFQMGDASDGNKREIPVHPVTLDDFAVGMYEVTFDQYDAFCNATEREKPADEGWGRGSQPVINVSWEDANAYAEWLSRESGLELSLPSEAQWEYFARAGTTSSYWTGDALPENGANCSECGSKWDNKMTAPTGSFKPNPWKLYDTSGNVAEWVMDDYRNSYLHSSADGSVFSEDKGTRKIQRGGAWNYKLTDLRSASRDHGRSVRGYKEVGFRLILNNPDLPSAVGK